MTFILSQGSFDKKNKQKNKNLQNKNQFNYVAIFPYKIYFNTSIINIRSKLMSHITVKDKQTKKNVPFSGSNRNTQMHIVKAHVVLAN